MVISSRSLKVAGVASLLLAAMGQVSCGSARASYDRERLTLLQQINSLEGQLAAANNQIARLTEREGLTSQQRAEESEECRVERTNLQSRLDKCEVDRVSCKKSDKGLLQERINDCRKNTAKEYQRGVSDGKLSVLNAVEVMGVPEVREGWITDDHYYRFEVKVGGKRFSLIRVRTHEEETPFGTVLAGINDLKVLVLRR